MEEDVEKLNPRLVSPYIFVVLCTGFFVTGLFCSSLVKNFSLHPVAFLFIGVGLAFYVIGCQFVLPDKRRLYFWLTISVVTFYGFQQYGLVGLSLAVVAVLFLLFIERTKGEWLVIIGVSLFLVELVTKGVPLFDAELRKDYVDAVFILGYCFLFLGITFMAKSYDTKYVVGLLVGSSVLLSLFTYRVYVLELVIVVMVSLYMLGKVKLTHIVVSGVLLFLLVLFIGLRGVAYQKWDFNALELFLFRPAFTFNVLNELVRKAGWFGITHGGIWLHFSCGTTIGEYVFGIKSNITGTVLGPLILDGGIFELVLMAFFGAVMNTMYRKALRDGGKVPFYAVALAIFLVGVDVSFVPSIVLLMVAGLYFVSEGGT